VRQVKDPVCGSWCRFWEDGRVWCPECNIWWVPGSRALDGFGVRA